MEFRVLCPKLPPLPWTLAAPSFVWPAGLAENCLRLQDIVDEVALLFFESQACLEYTSEDIPPWLAGLNLRFHVHLPLDLPWESGPHAVVETISSLAEKVAFLRPNGYVLHPPCDPRLFASFYQAWIDAGFPGKQLLLENIQGNDLSSLWPGIRQGESSICLDVGHALLFEQQGLLEQEEFWDRLVMLHVYGDGPGHAHASLSQMSAAGKELVRVLLQGMHPGAIVVLEMFSSRELQESLDIFSTWVRNWGLQ